MKSRHVLFVLGLALVPWTVAGQEAPEPAVGEWVNQANLAGQRAREIQARLARRGEEIAEIRTDFRQRLDESRKRAREIEARPRGDGRRESDFDRLFGDLRGLVLELRRLVIDTRNLSVAADQETAGGRRDAVAVWQTIRDWRRSAEDEAPVPEALERWRAAVDERRRAAGDLVQLEKLHRDEAFVLLMDAKALRRSIRSEVSTRVRRADRRYLATDLETEAKLIFPSLLVRARYLWRNLLELPAHWREWDVVRAWLVGVLWTLVVAALWWWARRPAPRWVPLALRLWAARSKRYMGRDLRSMVGAGERTATALIDLGACGALLGFLGGTGPELDLALFIYFHVALYRLLLGLTALGLARHPEVRPALVTLQPEARDLAVKTVRLFVLTLILRHILSYFAAQLLVAVTLDEVLRLFFDLVLAGLAVWFFHTAESALREAAQRRDPANSLVAVLTRLNLGPLRALKGLAMALVLLGLGLRDLVFGPGLGMALDPLRRKKDDDDDDVESAELPGEVVKQLLVRESPENAFVERPEAGEKLDRALRRWQEERRRGATVLLGAQGMGKRTFLDRWCAALAGRDLTVRRLRLTQRLTTAEEACRWLAEALEIEDPPADPRGLAGRINAGLAGQVLVLEDLDLSFLRRVGGFAALDFLLAVVGSASRQLFWVLSVHRPAWTYLVSLRGRIDTEVGQRVVELIPWREEELRRLVHERTAAAGYEVGFSRLLPASGRHRRDPLVHERAVSEYFRRLTWSSEGNPSVALRLWRRTLEPGDVDHHLEVARFCSPGAIPELRDPELFLLAAIHTHRSLTEDELVTVTNMNRAQAVAIAGNLETRRLLTSRSKRYSIEPRYLPAITADLRRRHFIHGSA